MKNNVKYTKKQICEALNHWKKLLREMNGEDGEIIGATTLDELINGHAPNSNFILINFNVDDDFDVVTADTEEDLVNYMSDNTYDSIDV